LTWWRRRRRTRWTCCRRAASTWRSGSGFIRTTTRRRAAPGSGSTLIPSIIPSGGASTGRETSFYSKLLWQHLKKIQLLRCFETKLVSFRIQALPSHLKLYFYILFYFIFRISMKIELAKSLKHTLHGTEVLLMILVESVVEIYFCQFHRSWIQ
jgi:hypothetical protein